MSFALIFRDVAGFPNRCEPLAVCPCAHGDSELGSLRMNASNPSALPKGWIVRAHLTFESRTRN